MSLDEFLNKFKDRFSTEDRELLLSKRIVPSLANRYGSRYDAWQICKLVKEGCGPQKANRYNKRFSAEDIVFKFVICGCSPEKVEEYGPDLSASEISFLCTAGCSLDDLAQYDRNRFSITDIGHLFEAGCSNEKAMTYNKRFNGQDIADLHEEGCPSEKADKYNTRFNGLDIAWLSRVDCPSEKADEYNPKFSGMLIAHLFKEDISPERAEKYFEFGPDMENLIYAGCPPEKVEEYGLERFSVIEISELHRMGCSPEKAKKYDPRFNGYDIGWLHDACPPEQAREYIDELRGNEIALLYRLGIRPENTDKEKQKRLHETLSGIIKFMNLEKTSYKYELVDTGDFAFVLLKRDRELGPSAWKFSKKIGYECRLLRQVKESNVSLDNVVKAKTGVAIGDIALELEYIQGKTLKQTLEEQGKLPPGKVMRYAAGIFDGIQELRNAGIYHRDLHDRNIMIEQEKDMAVIIDLGHATQNPAEVYDKNRAYGGNNDLISLGQLMYKMATGHNLFNEGPGFTCYSEVKSQVKTEREKAYDNPKLKKQFLKKVRQNIKGKLGENIVTLLDDDLWTQPATGRVENARKMFVGYAH